MQIGCLVVDCGNAGGRGVILNIETCVDTVIRGGRLNRCKVRRGKSKSRFRFGKWDTHGAVQQTSCLPDCCQDGRSGGSGSCNNGMASDS